jgi:photosystem II stability/assembly factor-like uncharacterized protein
VTRAGAGRIVAAGWRGLVGVSDDGGQSWTQAQVPVSVDLTSLCFTSERKGWAAGADGVLLETTDGGSSWRKRSDGLVAARAMVETYQTLATARPGDKAVEAALAEAKVYAKEGPGRPLLAVAFEGPDMGYAVGAFGMALRTTDGGATWSPMLERIDNPNGYHLYDMAVHKGGVFMAGELGTLLQLDRAQDRFVKVAVPYEGSLFTLLSSGETLLTAGLRGNAFVSADSGRSWQKADFGSATPGSFSSGTVLPGGAIALATQSGQIFTSADGGRRFVPAQPKSPMQYSALLDQGARRLLTAGPRGLRVEALG